MLYAWVDTPRRYTDPYYSPSPKAAIKCSNDLPTELAELWFWRKKKRAS